MLCTNLLYQPVDRLAGFTNHIVEQEEQDAKSDGNPGDGRERREISIEADF